MARFDLYQVANWRIPLMVDVQSNYADGIASRVVIPLRAADQNLEPDLPKLKPVLKIGDRQYILVTTDISAQEIAWLGKPVGNIAEHRDAITDALDFLFQGF